MPSDVVQLQQDLRAVFGLPITIEMTLQERLELSFDPTRFPKIVEALLQVRARHPNG